MSNRIELDNLSNPNDQHVVAGFGLGKIAGYDDIKDVLSREFISKIKKERKGENVDIPSAFFFFGPKGNGKTTSTLAIAEETGCSFEDIGDGAFSIDSFFDLLQDTAQKSQKNFSEKGRTIIFADEFTKFFGIESPIKQKIFDFLKDCSSKFHCTFFGTTNFLSEAGTEIKKINTVFVSYDPPGKINMMKVLKHYVDGREAGEMNYSDLADNLMQWAKDNNGTLGNSHLKTIVSAVSANTKRMTADDILKYAKDDFLYFHRLLDEKTLENYKTDYRNFIEN